MVEKGQTLNDKIKNVVDGIRSISDLRKFDKHEHAKDEEHIFLKELVHESRHRSSYQRVLIEKWKEKKFICVEDNKKYTM